MCIIALSWSVCFPCLGYASSVSKQNLNKCNWKVKRSTPNWLDKKALGYCDVSSMSKSLASDERVDVEQYISERILFKILSENVIFNLTSIIALNPM